MSLNKPLKKSLKGPLKRNIIICGLAKDVSKTITKNLDDLLEVGSYFSDKTKIIVVESNSTDDTVDLLHKWDSEHPGIMTLSTNTRTNYDTAGIYGGDGYSLSNNRFNKMAALRNTYMELMEKIPWYGDEDTYVIMVDLDLRDINPENVINIIEQYSTRSNWNVLCATGLEECKGRSDCHFEGQHYYDSLALRFLDEEPVNLNSLRQHEIRAWNTFKSRNDPDLPVKSCFGGLSIYRSSALKDLTYEGNDCEHVSLLRKISFGIFSLPGMVVYY
jgi:glycosyltransferase involved in cell wall biosynthesis